MLRSDSLLVPALLAAAVAAQPTGPIVVPAQHQWLAWLGGLTEDFGRAVAGAGDVDGDGVPDVVVGASGATLTEAGQGAVHVYSGRTGVQIFVFSGVAPNEGLGWSVAGIGDADGDGYPDLAAGAFGAGNGAGAVRVYSGRTGAQMLHLTGAAGARFGDSVAGAGDLDGDGCDDLIVGAPRDPIAGPNSGSARAYSGRTGAELLVLAGMPQALFGDAVASLDDLDGDGVRELLVGASDEDTTVLLGGTATVFSGRTGAVLYRCAGTGRNDGFGTAVAGIGDADADGQGDFAVGAPGNDLGGFGAGAVYVYSGRTGALRLLLLGEELDNLGAAVAGCGDVNGDGRADVLAGAPSASLYGNVSGSALVFSGRLGSVLLRIDGTTAFGRLGDSVAGIGDVNGDGIPDLAAGAPSINSTVHGAALALSGARLSLTSPTHRLSLQTGGTHPLDLDAGAAHAGASYWMLGSVSGTSPGLMLGSLTLPLNPDGYLLLAAQSPTAAFLTGGIATLGADGRAQGAFTVPPLPPGLVGLTFHHAYVLYEPGAFSFASNAVPLTFVP